MQSQAFWLIIIYVLKVECLKCRSRSAKMKFFLILILSFVVSSCVSSSESEQEIAHRKMRMMSTKIKKQEKVIERLKAKNLVLDGRETKLKRRSISDRARADLSSMTEKSAFKKVMSYYKMNDERMLKSSAKNFRQKFPKSTYLDNIFYMMGSLKLKNKDYVKSIRYFDQVAKKYPTQDKAPFSIYAKGLVYKKLGLKDQAVTAFETVAKKYPSSKAAKKAIKEIKTLQ